MILFLTISGNAYLHRKTFIDPLFIKCDASQFADVVKLYIQDKLGGQTENLPAFSPLVRSKFKQLQTTGQEAELNFMHNFHELDIFKNGVLEDALNSVTPTKKVICGCWIYQSLKQYKTVL